MNSLHETQKANSATGASAEAKTQAVEAMSDALNLLEAIQSNRKARWLLDPAMDKLRAALASQPALTQPAATGQAVGVARISLNGFQLRAALEFAAPDGDDEQLESEVTIQYGPARTDDDGAEAAGMFCWISDYPGEGSIRLDDCPSPAQTEAV